MNPFTHPISIVGVGIAVFALAMFADRSAAMGMYLATIICTIAFIYWWARTRYVVHNGSVHPTAVLVVSISLFIVLFYALIYNVQYNLDSTQYRYSAAMLTKAEERRLANYHQHASADDTAYWAMIELYAAKWVGDQQRFPMTFEIPLSDGKIFYRYLGEYKKTLGGKKFDITYGCSLKHPDRNDDQIYIPTALVSGSLSGVEKELRRKLAYAETPQELATAAGAIVGAMTETRAEILGGREESAIDQSLNIWDFVFLSMATFTTLGTDTIVPSSTFSRLIMASQAFMAIIIGAISVVLVVHSKSKERNPEN